MEKAAESAVLRKEHLAWAHHQIGPVEDEVDEDADEEYNEETSTRARTTKRNTTRTI